MRHLALSSAFVIGISIASAGVASASPVVLATPAPVKCAIPKPCALFTNTAAGTALQASGNNGPGLTGLSSNASGIYGSSAAGNAFEPGVEGESSNGNGMDSAGLFGASYFSTGVPAAYGTIAFGSSSGAFGEAVGDGVSAIGYGVFGQDAVTTPSNSGDKNVAVLGLSTVGASVLGEANGAPQVSVYGDSPVGVYAVTSTKSGTLNPNAFAFFGETNSFGVDIHNLGNNSSVFVSYPSGFLEGSGTTGSFSIDNSGNERLSGTLTTSKGGPYVRTTGSSGAAVREYGDRMTAPEVEDVGEAQLANGHAYIPIDARLADTIDRRIAYHVFVTPEGDCNGLYVTQKSPAGFSVRELRGGRSTLAFEYRIVAKPLDENGQRLESMPAEKIESDGAHGVRRPAPAPLSPQDRLKRYLGPERYAAAVESLRQRQFASR
jgi:hypothetical protein